MKHLARQQKTADKPRGGKPLALGRGNPMPAAAHQINAYTEKQGATLC